VAWRNLGVAGQIELAEAAALPPRAQMLADADGTGRVESQLRGHAKSYHAEIGDSMTSEVIDLPYGLEHRRSVTDQPKEIAMIRPSPLLQLAIRVDAALSGVMALLLTFGASMLAPLLRLPQPLLLEAGLFLIAYAAFVGWLGSRTAMPRALVLLIIAGNALWTLGSVALLFSGAVTPNLPGIVFVALQAIAVGAFAELQYLGLRRSGSAQPA
jgi:hypothetical protein